MVRLLLENGAEVNSSDKYGRTVADWLGHNTEILDILNEYAPDEGLLRGADLNLSDHARRDWLDQISVVSFFWSWLFRYSFS